MKMNNDDKEILTRIYKMVLRHRRNLRKDGFDEYMKDVDGILNEIKKVFNEWD